MSEADNVTALREEPLVPMPMPGGREQFWNLIAFLDNKKSFMARMNKLEESTKKHNDAVKLLGSARRIKSQLEKAAKVEAAADELLQAARAEASKIAENSEAEQAKLNKFSDTLQGIKVELTAGLDKLADDRKTLDEREAELQKRDKQLAASWLKAEKALQDGNELKGQFQAKLEDHKNLLKVLENLEVT